MVNKKDTLELVDLEDLPVPTRSVAWPYEKWDAEIPPGKAIEISGQLKGRKASTVASTIMMTARRKKFSIRAMVRNNRIWIYKEAEEIE